MWGQGCFRNREGPFSLCPILANSGGVLSTEGPFSGDVEQHVKISMCITRIAKEANKGGFEDLEE